VADISMTDFVEFIVRSGRPKQTKVKEIKERPDYDRPPDYWAQFRDGIKKFHRSGSTDKQQLSAILGRLRDPKKMDNYTSAVHGYQRFLGRKKIEWFEPPRQNWTEGGLTVRVNPELGLVINGQRHVLKLYLKPTEKATLKSVHAEALLELMEVALRPQCEQDDVLAILHVHRPKLYASQARASVAPLLVGEAASFMAIWEQV